MSAQEATPHTIHPVNQTLFRAHTCTHMHKREGEGKVKAAMRSSDLLTNLNLELCYQTPACRCV